MINEELTFKIRGAIYEVFKAFGPGLFERVYEKALLIELRSIGLKVASQLPVGATYKGEDLDLGFRLDLLVENEVIIEVKSITELQDVHKKQLLTYLRLTGKKVGLLVNFNSAHIQDKISLILIVN
jgi:GxxExxY protein